MEAQKLDKDVIYVYTEPVFSEDKIRDMGIENQVNKIITLKAKFELLKTCRKNIVESDDFLATTDLKEFFSLKGFVKRKKQKYELSEENKKDEKNILHEEDELNKLFNDIENKQIDWFPLKYKEKFTKTVNHDLKSEEDLKKYINSLPIVSSKIIQEMKAELPSVEFLTIDELNSLANENKIQIVNTRRFAAGQVFIRHPFVPDTYMDVEESENTLFHIKMQCLSRIMQCLGASHISGHAYVSETKKREIDVNGKISYKVVDIDGNINKTRDEKYETDYSLEDTFAGGFSQESYEEALNEAKRVGLYDDFDVKNLLDQRNPEKQNKMLGRKVKIELNRELNENLDSAFGLQAAGFTMNGTYKDILETERKVMFELQIEF